MIMLTRYSNQIHVYYQQIDPVVKVRGGKIVRVSTLSLQRFQAKRLNERGNFTGQVFIDCSYEGDLVRLSGISFSYGREANTKYNESYAGAQGWPFSHSDPGQIFPTAEDWVVDPFNHSTGELVPGIQGKGLPPPGSADSKTQCFNFRICITNNATIREGPFEKPAGYNPAYFEVLRRYLVIHPEFHQLYTAKCPGQHRQQGCGMFLWTHIRYGKVDLNALGPFSADAIGLTENYPIANWTEKQRIYDNIKLYMQGLLYFMAYDPAVPKHMQEEFAQYGLCKDEYPDNSHFPWQLYVR